MNYILIDTLNIDNEEKEYFIGLGTKKELQERIPGLILSDKLNKEYIKRRYLIVREDKL